MTDPTKGRYATELIHYITYVRGFYTQRDIDALRMFHAAGWGPEDAAQYVMAKIMSGADPTANLDLYLQLRSYLRHKK